jgi:hypothetical protein
MKDAVITVRLPRTTRKRIEHLARREGRSLSQQVERLIERGMSQPEAAADTGRRARPLSGILRGGRVPTLADFRQARSMLSTSFGRRSRDHTNR